MEMRHDMEVRKARQNQYSNELGGMVVNKSSKLRHDGHMNADLEANHRGLDIGHYKGGNKDGLMEALQHQIDEKAEMRKNLDHFRTEPSMPNDFLNYKQRFDLNNLHLVLESRQQLHHSDNYLAKEKLRELHDHQVRKAEESNAEKLHDFHQMNDQVAHERKVLQEEYLRRAGKGDDLKDGLQHQMHNKHFRASDQVHEDRAFKNTFQIGGTGSYGITNIDIRPQIVEKEARQARENAEVKDHDHHMVSQLDQYDRNKVNLEQARKKEFGMLLNKTLNEQMVVVEAKKGARTNAIKARAANYPKRSYM